MKDKQIQGKTIKQYRIYISVMALSVVMIGEGLMPILKMEHDRWIRRGGNLPKIDNLQLRSRKG